MSARISRNILITGGNGGLGRAIARAFFDESEDNSVWLGVRCNRTDAEEMRAEFPGRCELVELDVTDRGSWQTVVEGLVKGVGRVDVLVNCAGGHQDGLLGNMALSAWRGVMSANLDGVFHGCQAVLPTMITQRQGRIINISSLSALLAPIGQTNYAAAKAGVLALTQSLAKEVARIGITVNAICPGYVDTEALSSMGTEERKAAERNIPMRRFGRPEEVAAAVRFLACAEASYITGSCLKVDGGIL